MYDKLEKIRYYLEDTEIENLNKNFIIDIIDDIERDLEINDATYRYLEDFNE